MKLSCSSNKRQLYLLCELPNLILHLAIFKKSTSKRKITVRVWYKRSFAFWFCRGWDGWMASPTQWTWLWVNSGRPGVLQSMGLQRVRHDWAADLNWTESFLPNDGLTLSAISTLTLWLSKKSTADKWFVPSAKCKTVRFFWGNIICVFSHLISISPS